MENIVIGRRRGALSALGGGRLAVSRLNVASMRNARLAHPKRYSPIGRVTRKGLQSSNQLPASLAYEGQANMVAPLIGGLIIPVQTCSDVDAHAPQVASVGLPFGLDKDTSAIRWRPQAPL